MFDSKYDAHEHNFATSPACSLQDFSRGYRYVCDITREKTVLSVDYADNDSSLKEEGIVKSFNDAVFQTGKAIGAFSAYNLVNNFLPFDPKEFNSLNPAAVISYLPADLASSFVFFSVLELGSLNPEYQLRSGIAATAANVGLQTFAKDGTLLKAVTSSLSQSAGFMAGFEFNRSLILPIFGKKQEFDLKFDSHQDKISVGLIFYAIDSAVQGVRAFVPHVVESFVPAGLGEVAVSSGLNGFIDPLMFNLIYEYSNAASEQDVTINVMCAAVGSALMAAAKCAPLRADPSLGSFSTCVGASLLKNAITASGFVASVYFVEDILKPAYMENWLGQALESVSAFSESISNQFAGDTQTHTDEL